LNVRVTGGQPFHITQTNAFEFPGNRWRTLPHRPNKRL
jgi:hypothetical protein